MRGLGDGGNILHLECERAGAFAEHRFGVGLEQRRDVGGGRIIARLDAKALQRRVAEMPRRPIDAVGHQQMIAAADHRQDRGRTAFRPDGTSTTLRAAFQFADARPPGFASWACRAGHRYKPAVPGSMLARSGNRMVEAR